jgi:fucokinase
MYPDRIPPEETGYRNEKDSIMSDTLHTLQRIWNSTVYEWNRQRQSGRKRRPAWDTLILTAANPDQARGYEVEIARRREIGMIPPETQVLIVPDRAGERIGSGGATLGALKQYAEETHHRNPPTTRENPEYFFTGKRVLLMHCGGEGRRVPSNAGTGKIFASLPFEVMHGRSASAFDALYVFLCACGEQMREGLVIVSGDVLAVFDPTQLHWQRSGCSGIGIPAPLELAAHHGVYVASADGRRVDRYLQKASPEQLTEAGACCVPGKALVDGAGILRFSPAVCATLTRLAGYTGSENGRSSDASTGLIESPQREGTAIDLYTDIAWPLVRGMSQEEYLGDSAGGRAFVRRTLWDALRGTEFWLDVFETSLFVHLGNLWEILDTFSVPETENQSPAASGNAAAIFGARETLASHIPDCIQIHPTAHVQNSYLDTASGAIGPQSLIAECRLTGTFRIGTRSLLRGIETDLDFDMEDKVALFAIPLLPEKTQTAETGPTAYCAHGVEDNPKTAFSSGARFQGQDFRQWLSRRGISPEDLWGMEIPEQDRSLWNARLYPLARNSEEHTAAFQIALWLQSSECTPDQTSRWSSCPRISFSDIFERIDYLAGFTKREERIRESLFSNIRQELERHGDPRSSFQTIGTLAEYERLRNAIQQWASETAHPLLSARFHIFEAELLACEELSQAAGRSSVSSQQNYSLVNAQERRSGARLARGTALRKVAEAVSQGVAQTEPLDLFRVRQDRVQILSPARIDFGGGWTDTPPQCLEQGGVILSAAVRLNGQYPVRASAEKIEERVIRIESESTRGTGILRTSRDLPLFQNLEDPFALVKAGLSAVGFCSLDASQRETGALKLEERLENWGHGLRIVTRSDAPRGSGLGTSSILGTTVLACLRRLFGAPLDLETLFRQTLYLEQLLTSGGGWQDQIGALAPGIKLARVPATPSFVLRPTLEPLELPSDIVEELNRRLVLFYVGKRRIAFNMLQEIVGGYMAGDTRVQHALTALYDLAFEMREALLAGDFERFGALMTRTRLLYRLMCPATTSETLETLFAAASPYTSGGKCVGAGGGGFIMMVARSARDAIQVREQLRVFSWRGLGEFYDFEIDGKGLHESEG